MEFLPWTEKFTKPACNFEVTKMSLSIVFPSAQVVACGLAVTKVSLFIVFPPCPRGGLRPRSYQSVAIQRLPPPAQVVACALGVTKASLSIMFPPHGQHFGGIKAKHNGF